MPTRPTHEGWYLIDMKTNACRCTVMIHKNFRIARPRAGDDLFKFLPYQLSIVE